MESFCPQCRSENIYQDASLWICPECSHEWTSLKKEDAEQLGETSLGVRDANGNLLQDGDAVSVVKDLKVKGSSSSLKVGTKIKNIRLIDAEDGHNIACKIEGFGSMNLKSEFVKKV